MVSRGILTAVPADTDDLDDVMEAICLQFEQDTGYIPFMASASVSVRNYTLQGGSLLFLNAGLCGGSDALVIEVDDVAQTLGTSFVLLPTEAPDLGMPWTQIQFLYDVVSEIGGITIENQWGFCEVLPGNVLRGLLQGGAAEYLRDISNTIVSTSGQVIEMKQDDVQKKFANVTSGLSGSYVGSLQQQFGAGYSRIVRSYQAPWKVLA